MQYQNKTIRAIEVDYSHITIDWILGDYCNYQCAYCWPGAHAGQHRVPALDDVMRGNIDHLIAQLRLPHANINKPLAFILSGGEPTMYHDIDNLLDFLASRGMIKVLTNASRTLTWWQRHGHKFDSVMISYHADSADYDHVTAVIRQLVGKVNVGLHMMISLHRFDQCMETYKRFLAEFQGLPIDIKSKLLVDDQGELLGYDQQQRQAIDALAQQKSHAKIGINDRLDAVIRLQDQAAAPWDNTAIKDFSGSFNQYLCRAHHEFVSIKRNGNCGTMHCGQQFSPLANIYSEDFVQLFQIDTNAIECSRVTCGCIGLYTTNKHLDTKNSN